MRSDRLAVMTCDAHFSCSLKMESKTLRSPRLYYEYSANLAGYFCYCCLFLMIGFRAPDKHKVLQKPRLCETMNRQEYSYCIAKTSWFIF